MNKFSGFKNLLVVLVLNVIVKVETLLLLQYFSMEGLVGVTVLVC